MACNLMIHHLHQAPKLGYARPSWALSDGGLPSCDLLDVSAGTLMMVIIIKSTSDVRIRAKAMPTSLKGLKKHGATIARRKILETARTFPSCCLKYIFRTFLFSHDPQNTLSAIHSHQT